MAFLFVAAFYCLLDHLNVTDRRWLIPISPLLAASLYTHNMMLPYLPAFFLAWLVLPSDQKIPRRLLDAAITILAIALLYSPWAIFGLPTQLRLVGQGFWAQRPAVSDILTIAVWLFDTPPAFSWNHTFARLHLPITVQYFPIVFGLILLAASLAVSLTQLRGPRLRNAFALMLLVLLPLTLVSIYSFLRTPLLMDKTFLPSATVAPILLLLPLTANLSRLPRRLVIAGAILISMVSLSTLIAYETVQKKEAWRTAAQFVADLPPQRRLIVFTANDGQLPFNFYYHPLPGDQMTGVPAGFFDRNPPRAMMRVHGPQDLQNLRRLLSQNSYDQIVLIVSHPAWADPDWLTYGLLRDLYLEQSASRIDSEIAIVQFAPRSSPLTR
jgi:hypothetical protein